MNTSGWFYIEPYVHISIRNDGVLLYNTLNGMVMEDDYAPIVRLVRRLRSSRNLLVVKLKRKEVDDGRVAAFVRQAREAFVGDVLDRSFSRGKPIEMMPKLHMQRDSGRKSSRDASVFAGLNVMRYLAEITLYINDSCGRRCPTCWGAYRQFLACTRGTGHIQELAIADIESLFEQTKGSGLVRVDIVGGDIFRHSRFGNLADLLSGIAAVKVYVTHCANLKARDEYLSLIAADKNAELRILVTFPLDDDGFGPIVPLLRRTGIRYGVDFFVQDENDLKAAQRIVSDLKTETVSFKACYNGTNTEFLKSALFVSREDIRDAKPSLRDVFARMAVNPLNFGKLVVLSDGTVRANINGPDLGSLRRDSVHDVVYRAVVNRSAWRALRTNADPCKTCAYNLLCPPLTDYETVLGRRNLCDVR